MLSIRLVLGRFLLRQVEWIYRPHRIWSDETWEILIAREMDLSSTSRPRGRPKEVIKHQKGVDHYLLIATPQGKTRHQESVIETPAGFCDNPVVGR